MISTEMGNQQRRRLRIWVVILYAVILWATGLGHGFAGPIKFKFEHFTIEDGLPQDSVFCILQDSRGFLWVGTENGLCRYDGYTFKPYQSDPDNPETISHNKVLSICESRSGTLWIGTDDGLNKFDRLREKFTRYRPSPHISDPTSKSNNVIRAIFEDQYEALWIGTDSGILYRFTPADETFTPYQPDLPKEPEAENAEHSRIITIRADSRHILWVGTGSGLFTFNPQEEKFTSWELEPGKPGNTSHTCITCIYKDRSGVLWIGTKDGRLAQFHRKEGYFTLLSYDPDISPGNNDFRVHSIFEDQDKGFWLGVYKRGLYRRDPQKRDFYCFKEQPEVPTSLSNNHIHSFYEDRSGILWIGTENGLNKLDKRKSAFVYWTKEIGKENDLSDNVVWAIYKDKTGILWIGTNKGLNRIDRDTGTFTHYRENPQDPQSLSNDRVMTICEDHLEYLWLGTQGGGLNRFDKKTGTFSRFSPPVNFSIPAGKSTGWHHVSHERIYVLWEDRKGALWIGTQDGGLNKLDPDRKTFTYYTTDQNNPTKSLSHKYVCSIFEDKAGFLWVGTGAGGLNIFNPATETFTHFKKDTNNQDSLSDDYVSIIHEDRFGTIWVGTAFGGLNKLLDRKNGVFKHYRKKDGLANDTINGILEDDNGCLWISSVNGISKFDPKTDTIKNYFAGDGLQNNEFNGGAWFKARDGEMFFGGNKGFNSFYPKDVIQNQYPPSVVITDFQVFNQPYGETSITEEKKIVLTHNDYVFSIEFAALDFSMPEKNLYEYKMEGVDKQWVQANAKQRLVTYAQLSPAKYIFRVKGINNDGIGSDKVASLRITITPPFYLTWWFRVLLGILLILAVIAFHLLRTKRLREKIAHQRRIQEILKQSHDEMERAKDLAELRHAENEKLLSAISSIFIAVDSNGMIFQWNKPAEYFFSIPARDAVNQSFIRVLAECLGENNANDIIERGLKGEQSTSVIEYSVDFKAKGKGIRLLISNINPIRDRSGRKLGFLMVAEDITNRKEEEMLRNLSKKLESLGQMASSIAHEIKTPLQYIGHNATFVCDSFNEVVRCYNGINDTLGRLEAAGDREIPGEIKELMAKHEMDYILEEIPKASDQIINGVNRVSDIIQAMNEFSHPGKGFMEKADINQLLKSTLIMVQSKIKKNADIELELSDSLPPIPCYAGELNQVFLNLLINAVDAIVDTKKWGLIKITTKIEENNVVITISDTGCGIPDENKDHIFTPFFTTKEVGKGTGQGLSLAHNVIIEKHKGKLHFSSQLSKGTTFYIYLPFEGDQ